VPKKSFTVTRDSGAGVRLDVYLARRVPDFTRSQFQRFVDKGQVKVNAESKKSSTKLAAGDRIEIDIEMPEATGIVPEDIPLGIIDEDASYLVIDKPSGMTVHPGAGNRRGTLVHALLYHYPEIKGLGDEERPGIVHRLDKDTSGVMVVARNPAAYFELKRQFKAREVKKVYLALVWGKPARDEGSLDWPIGRHVRRGERMSISTKKPRTAITEYSVLTKYQDVSLLEVRPLTGRTHQIRVHMAAAGHPVVGDRRYGSAGKSERRFPRLFLHAHILSFRHPDTELIKKYTSPLPDELRAVLDSLPPAAPSLSDLS